MININLEIVNNYLKRMSRYRRKPVSYQLTESGCFEISSHRLNRNGYGRLRLNDKDVVIHRITWMAFYGEIPNDLQVLHKCDNRKCINPKHLFLGTNTDNMRDKALKGRGCKGENNPKAKLTWQKVINIRESYLNGEETIQELANKHGVRYRTIIKIIRYERWRQ